MKIHKMVLGAFLMIGCTCSAQLKIIINNVDATTHKKLGQMNADLLLIVGANESMSRDLKSASENLTERMKRDYTGNPYDKDNAAIASWTGGALAIANKMVGMGLTVNDTPYFTPNKKKYIDAVADEAIIEMLAFQGISKTNIRSSDRQAIYRIRRDIIREHSKNQRYSRRLMVLSTLALAIEKSPELMRSMELLEVAF